MAKIIFFLTAPQIRELTAIEKNPKHKGNGVIDALVQKGWIAPSWELTEKGKAVLGMARQLELELAGEAPARKRGS